MRISTSKSEAMVLDRKNVACTIQAGGEFLPQVEEFKYLGVLFTSEGRMYYPSETDIVATEPSFVGGRRSVRVLGVGRRSALQLGGGRRLALLLGCGRHSALLLGCGCHSAPPLGCGQNHCCELNKFFVELQIFNDSVHGHIKMHPLLVDITDTPEFQRLRNIKQMGGIYYVFPGASHNRFEHSIGVCHLAGELVNSLKAQGQDISSEDILCVQIAGLCHDLGDKIYFSNEGHGPFSHLFEEVTMELSEKLVSEKGESEITKALKNWKWPYKGRSKEKSYLYEIVANKCTGIDVDKMDYISRDCLHLGMKSNFSHERFMMFARVCSSEKEDKMHICMRDKEAINMYELFHNRYMLHYTVCHHRVKVAIEAMITDALVAAEGYFKLGDKTISEAVLHPETYLKLTDNILMEIMRSTDKDLNSAQEIIRRIQERKLYKFVGSKIFQTKEIDHLGRAQKKVSHVVVQDWLQYIRASEHAELKEWKEWINEKKLDENDFIVKSVELNYGKKEENPIEYLRFYRKNQPNKSVELDKDEVHKITHNCRVYIFMHRFLAV
ncbi:hypothetical protein QTP70_029797 [Hemibagrus guttatus]|uniref:HD domain-containing protein n=1 Tax=Hemibagrus guttatus TaxID=175788 RepID=A0AAE0URD7_9TELE|nr:hypothetical protein QTP70_029797 [Hemibagrus guttatus]